MHVLIKCSIDNDKYAKTVSYNELISYIERETDQSVLCKYNRITLVKDLSSVHLNWKGSKYNVMIEWEM